MGARAKILEKVKLIGKAIVSFAIKLGTEEIVLDKAPGGGAGDEDQPPQDDEEEELGEIVERFLSTVDDKGLDDHPDVFTSPILMYQIKKAKEEQLAQQRITVLAAEGLTEDEIAERMAMDGGPSGPGAGPKNALALLVSVGARVEAVRGGKDTDHLARIEARRKQRTVDVFLQKQYDIHTKKTERKVRDKKGAHIKSALQIAHESKRETVTSGPEWRSERNATVAKSARGIYRHFQKTAPQIYFGNDTDDEKEEDDAQVPGRKSRGPIDANALAQLQAEYADIEFDEMEPQDEGEDGDEDTRV